MTNKFSLLLLIVFLPIFVFAENNKREFKVPEGFSITIPKSWVEIPIDVLHEHSKILKKSPETEKFSYNYGFQRKFKTEWFEPPFILVMINEEERTSPSELADVEKFKKETEEASKEAKKSFGSLAPEITVNSSIYDKKYQILWTEQSLDYGFGKSGIVKCMAGVVLTDKGTVNVMCYALNRDYRRRKNLFRAIIQSVKLDEILVYKERSSIKKQNVKGGNFLSKILHFIIAFFKFFFGK